MPPKETPHKPVLGILGGLGPAASCYLYQMLTDHTPGYGSAAKYIATILKEVICDSSVYDLRSVTVAEIMGRHTGWLAAAAIAKQAGGRCASGSGVASTGSSSGLSVSSNGPLLEGRIVKQISGTVYTRIRT